MTSRKTESPMRARLLESAAHLLATEGPSGLSTRKVAAQAGTSTMSLYAQFGSMPELVRAVVDEGFARLATQFDRVVETDDPIADLGSVFAAYIASGRADPDLYVVMFGSASLGGYRTDAQDLHSLGRHTFDFIAAGAERAVEAGRLKPLAPVAVAAQIWSALHGYMTLELAGYFTPPDAGVRNVLAPLMLNLVVGLGDDHDRAVESSRSWFVTNS
ncbi:TetR/AcrR family transcriptional regulator [Nocardia sp. NPDC058633]|uniref:TetR/AcrR family transcriptional regulator n=1 Tax=Nocardia sp. NPDC058633 TaxID=3346568 RepID=UPI00366902DC